MHDSTLSHLSDAVLLRDLAALVAQDRSTTATLLAHLGEVDSRRLYVPAGYPSMYAYCVEELHLSEDAASKRIQAARAARQFPALFGALAEGRLHLAAVCLLAPHLTLENADELIEAATHRRKFEVEGLVARRFSHRGSVSSITVTHSALPQHAPGHVGTDEHAPGHVGTDEHAPGHVEESDGKMTIPAAECFLVQLTIASSTREKLRYAQALLSHAVPTGDVAQVLDRALDALIAQLEKRKIGAGTHRSSDASSSSLRPQGRAVRRRYIPAHIRRAVWERDKAQCTFVSSAGHRCATRRFLEFDHVEPAARGGKATVEGLRLRCRAHNQLEAERAFGADFMSRKRYVARLAVAATRARAAAEEEAAARDRAAAKEQVEDVFTGLRGLGCRPHEARRAAEFSEALQVVTLEERMRAALAFLGRKPTRVCTTTGAG